MNTKTLVICFSGISGAGKTTIVRAIQKALFDTEVLSFDSYDDMLHKDFFDWSDRGADYNEWDLSPMINDIEGIIEKHPSYILLDFPFGYGNEKMAKYIDFAIWIDTPLDIAIARRVIRDFTERDPERNKINNLFENLNFTMKAYLNHDRMMYIQHIDTVKPFCDFFVDGTGNIEDIVKSIIETISQVQKSNNVLE